MPTTKNHYKCSSSKYRRSPLFRWNSVDSTCVIRTARVTITHELERGWTRVNANFYVEHRDEIHITGVFYFWIENSDPCEWEQYWLIHLERPSLVNSSYDYLQKCPYSDWRKKITRRADRDSNFSFSFDFIQFLFSCQHRTNHSK